MRDISQLKKRIEEAFGTELTAQQLWALTLFAKHVRLRARNNAAFNNFCNAMFPHARFRQVQKSKPDRFDPSKMYHYEGLQITVKDQAPVDMEDED